MTADKFFSSPEEAKAFLRSVGLRVDDDVMREILLVLQGKSGKTRYDLYKSGTTREGKARDPISGKATVAKVERLYREGRLDPYLRYLGIAQVKRSQFPSAQEPGSVDVFGPDSVAVENNPRREGPSAAPSEATSKIQRARGLDLYVERLSEPARELLKEAAQDRNGNIGFIEGLGSPGLTIETNGRSFVEGHSPRSAARWRQAVRDLHALRLIEPRTPAGEMYFVTDKGYQVADAMG
jgi:hypothetical protein